MKMTRLEHANEAERWLRLVVEAPDLDAATLCIATAQVHATLATITADTTPRPVRSQG